MATAFRVFRVLRPVRIHRAAIRHLDADRPLRQHGSARHHPHCSSLGAARRCPPGSPLFAPSDRHGATGRCVPTIASVPRALGRTESIAGQQHQRPGWRAAPMPGTAQPRTIRTGPPTWCHRPQQVQRPAAPQCSTANRFAGSQERCLGTHNPLFAGSSPARPTN